MDKLFRSKIVFEDDDPERLERIFYPESSSLKNRRFSYRLKKQKKGVVFELEAKDETAFKTVKTSINKLLDVYSKVKCLCLS